MGITHQFADRKQAPPSAEFDRWWRSFRRRAADDEPHEAARRLRRKLGRVRVAERPFFVADLLWALLRHERAYGVTLFLLEGLGEPIHLRQIEELLRPLPELQTDDEESHLADLIRLVAVASGDRRPAVLEDYLLDRPIGPHWSSVPWSVWPMDEGLFARAWCRFFAEHEPDAWTGSFIVRSFLAEPRAVRSVRELLAAEHPGRWAAFRQSLLRQAGVVSWLTDEQRDALDEAVS